MKIAPLYTLCFVIPAAGSLLAAETSSTNQVKLPLTEITLFTSGVGYFQRDGKVNGNAELNMSFRQENINDLLKSLVVQDFDKGGISSVTYDSRDPLEKTLQSFGIDVASNPSMAALLTQIRGEEVEVETSTKIVGTIISVETKHEKIGEDTVREESWLNLLTEEGLRSVKLPVNRIRLLNEELNKEFGQALAVLAKGHDSQKKAVNIGFSGDGERNVSVSYIMEAPVWKTSYRLVLGKDKPFLQGWAIVENTTDDDWKGVQLGLVSGRPISFTMELYEPLYNHRPQVQLELYSSLKPALYGDSLGVLMEQEVASLQKAESDSLNYRMSTPAPAAPAASSFGITSGAAGPARKARSMAVRENQAFFSRDAQAEARAQGSVAGELFQYKIDQPVDLPRHKSAMLPIISESVDGSKVSIYTEKNEAKHPLNGYRLKNISKLNLMQGPITVFDDGIYAGDARIEDLAPGQERLISYALDLKVEIDPKYDSNNRKLETVKFSKGVLHASHVDTRQKSYAIKNKDSKDRTILIEHPLESGWDLLEPKEPLERTRENYRFEVKVNAGKTETLKVREQRKSVDTFMITNLADDQLLAYVRTTALSDKGKAALQKVVKMRSDLAETRNKKARLEQQINEITQEQTRIRENMTRLAQNSELYQRYVKKFDQQETDVEGFRNEIKQLTNLEVDQANQLQNYILSLDIQ
ncbi:MAG: hypothetical protein ACO1QB_17550 [Verrucomicrobiales bacterium]